MRFIHAKKALVLCGVVLALLSAVPAMAAIDAYMTIDGIKGAENVKVLSVVRDPYTPAGVGTGKRAHSTITITREVDEASPRLAQALVSKEGLKSVTITFNGATGGEKTAQKIVLTNANIVNIRKSGRNEIITFDYPAIEVTWVNGGKSATDDWSTPN